MRTFSIWDFPITTRIKFNGQKEFLEFCIKKYGSIKNISTKINVSSLTIRSWIKYDLFIPLNTLEKLCKLMDIDKKSIQNNLVAYKGQNTSKPITKPIFPIKESPELFAIMGHLIADGSVNKNGIPMYVNTSLALRRNFKNSMQIFGEVEFKEYNLKNGAKELRFHKIIADFFKKNYSMKFGSKVATFPKVVFSLSDEIKASILRAVIDDEGTIRDGIITISMKNQELIYQLQSLFKELFSNDSVNKISVTKDGCYYFSTSAKHLQKISSKIAIVHPRKKEEILWYLSKERKTREGIRNGQRKVEILYLLKTKSFLTSELSRKLLINRSNVHFHMKKLYGKEFITSIKEKYSCRWYLTPIGRKYIQEMEGGKPDGICI